MARKDVTDKMVCEAVRDYQTFHDKWPYELLAERTEQPEKVCYRAMERADENGLLEYGVSLRTAWLTDAGMELLAANAELHARSEAE